MINIPARIAAQTFGNRIYKERLDLANRAPQHTAILLAHTMAEVATARKAAEYYTAGEYTLSAEYTTVSQTHQNLAVRSCLRGQAYLYRNAKEGILQSFLEKEEA